MDSALTRRKSSAARSTLGIVVLPWLAYVALLTGLSLAERNTSFTGELNQRLDLAFNLIVLVGLMVAAVRSARAVRSAASVAQRYVIAAGVLAGSVVGPVLSIVAVWSLANDVDGIWWMLNAPLLAPIVAIIAVAAEVLRSRRRINIAPEVVPNDDR